MDWASALKQSGALAAAALAIGTLLAALGLLPPTEAQVAEMITDQVRAMERTTASKSQIKELQGKVDRLQDDLNQQGKATVRIEERQESLGRRLDLIYDTLKRNQNGYRGQGR